MNHRELVLGTHSRSGDQWDIWESVYSPVGPDGYPKRIWDKRTGTIDRSVADYWREHHHPSYTLRRGPQTARPEPPRQLHLYRGRGGTSYLHGSLYLLEAVPQSAQGSASHRAGGYGP